MEYSLKGLKAETKQDLRKARPEAWLVTLVYLVASYALSALVELLRVARSADGTVLVTRLKEMYAMVMGGDLDIQRAVEVLLSMRGEFWGVFVDLVTFALIAGAVTWTLNYGYQAYCLQVVRGKKAGLLSLLCAFPKWGWVLLAGLCVELFLLCWAVFIAFVGVLGSAAILFLLPDKGTTLALVVMWGGLAVWLGAIAMSYSMANFILMDERVDGIDAIGRSMEMLRGRKRHLLVLCLSFAGVLLPVVAVAALVMWIGSAITGGSVGVDSFAVGLFTTPLLALACPYLTGAVAKFYDWMRRTDIQNGDWESSRAGRRRDSEEGERRTAPWQGIKEALLKKQSAPAAKRAAAPHKAPVQRQSAPPTREQPVSTEETVRIHLPSLDEEEQK